MLAFDAAGGETAMEDVPLGQVREKRFFSIFFLQFFPPTPPPHSLTHSHSHFPQLIRARFLAGARAKLWWMTPVWGQRGSSLPPETQFLLVELGPGGPYAAFVPLIDGSGSFRATLRPAR